MTKGTGASSLPRLLPLSPCFPLAGPYMLWQCIVKHENNFLRLMEQQGQRKPVFLKVQGCLNRPNLPTSTMSSKHEIKAHLSQDINNLASALQDLHLSPPKWQIEPQIPFFQLFYHPLSDLMSYTTAKVESNTMKAKWTYVGSVSHTSNTDKKRS